MKKILIKADTNDADFVSKLSDLPEDKEALIRKVAAEVDKVPGHNWNNLEWTEEEDKEHPCTLYKGKLSEEEMEAFSEFLPSGEHGIHTIYDINILEVISEEKLLT